MIEHGASLAEGQFPKVAERQAMADIEVGGRAFGAEIARVLRLRPTCSAAEFQLYIVDGMRPGVAEHAR